MHGIMLTVGQDIFVAQLLAQFDPVAWLGKLWPILLILVGFSVIVFVHELGHFAAAKWAGVRVDRFAIGFGRELFGFTRGETRYSFNILPLGGYVKMLGQEDFDDKANELKFKDDPTSFVNKPVGRRMIIVSAGVVMNVVFAFLLFMIVFMVGLERLAPKIGFVQPDSPADRAGLLSGDVVKEINGSTIREWHEVTMAVMLAPPFEPVEFVVERDGRRQPSIRVMPESNTDVARQTIGILPGVTNKIQLVGAGIDENDPAQPRVGDVVVEVAGRQITEENAIEAFILLPRASDSFFVERVDPDALDATPMRVKVGAAPLLSLYPSGPSRTKTGDLLGLVPLVRFDQVEEKGPAYLAGIEQGDAILMWDDIIYPDRRDIIRAYEDKPGRDIAFRLRKVDGRVVDEFIRPTRGDARPGTIQALCETIEVAGGSGDAPQAVLTALREGGAAEKAGLGERDVILKWGDIDNPTASQVRSTIRGKAGKTFSVTVRKPDGRQVTTRVKTQRPGSIRASFTLIANDYPLVAGIVPTIHGRPTPAAEAHVPVGAMIRAVGGVEVSRWSDVVKQFQRAAGLTVDLTYELNGQRKTVAFSVPNSLRTRLGLEPGAVIVTIDGRTTVSYESGSGLKERNVNHPEGTQAILAELAGRTDVPVKFRRYAVAPIEEATVDVTDDMLDPWLRRVQYQVNVVPGIERVTIKEPNPLLAVQLGIKKTYYFIHQVYQTIERMAFSRTVGVENISGPLGIVDIGAKVARQDFAQMLFFLAILSANLAVINFLPLPIVDGGLMIFLIIEKIKGTPVSLRVQIATQVVGLVLIISAFVWVTLQDVVRIWG